MKDAPLLFDIRGSVAWLTFNRPESMNALNLDVISLFEEYLPRIADDSDIKVLAITGRGKAFCAGADLKEVQNMSELPPGEQDFLDRACDNVFALLRDYPKPVVVAINGLAMAGGMEMALCADIVLAADNAQLGDAHANFGVYPGGGGAALLPRVLPLNVAKYLLFTGKTLPAQEMLGYGLVNKVVQSENLEQETQELAELIAEKSPIAIRRMKIVANHANDGTREAALQHEQVMFRKHMRSYDMAEGLKAFNEKRPPKFIGR